MPTSTLSRKLQIVISEIEIPLVIEAQRRPGPNDIPYGIPPEALAKILQRLAKAGLLQSQHGTNGGYTLARPAHTISAFEVIQAIDGPLFITSCVTTRGECDQSDRCNIREPLRKVNESIEAVLKRIKVSHMREEPEEGGGSTGKPVELVTIS